jgi:hypothetical protein
MAAFCLGAERGLSRFGQLRAIRESLFGALGPPTSQLNIERTWDEGRYTRANVLRELLRTQILAAKDSGWPAVRRPVLRL